MGDEKAPEPSAPAAPSESQESRIERLERAVYALAQGSIEAARQELGV